jgi:hypothetical protein
MLIAIPWIGVPVTTPRRAAALFRAKLAADNSANVAPSTQLAPAFSKSAREYRIVRSRAPGKFGEQFRSSRMGWR